MRDFFSNCIIYLANDLGFSCQRFENEKIISQIKESGKNCDQNNDRVSYYSECFVFVFKKNIVICDKKEFS